MATDKRTISPTEVHFHEFRLDLNLRRLYRSAEQVKLTPKPFNTLEFLIHNRHRIVSKAELLENVWGERRGESTVEQAVRQLRKALQDDPTIPQYIETIPGQGYRFIAPVVDQDGAAAEPTGAAARASRSDIDPAGEPTMVPVLKSLRSTWRGAAIGMAGLGVALLGLLFALRLTRSPNPQQATLVGAELTALDGAGRAIWRYRFPEPLQPTDEPMFSPNQNTQIHLVDLYGDGKNEVLVAAAYNRHSEINHDELYCFAPGGRLLWRYQPHAEFSFVGRKASGPWKLRCLTILPEDGKKIVWAAFTDPIFAPTIVASIDAEGRSQIRYVSSGNVNALAGLANKKGTFILAGGVNNEYRAASLAVLSSRQQAAASPQTSGNRFECTNCPSGRPLLFVVLPRSEVNVGSGKPYNWVNYLERRGGEILVSVLEQGAGEPGIDVRQYFELSDDLTPKNISFGAGYREAHERLEKRGLIAHTWADCQEQKHPAIARVWDEARGWREIQIPWVH